MYGHNLTNLTEDLLTIETFVDDSTVQIAKNSKDRKQILHDVLAKLSNAVEILIQTLETLFAHVSHCFGVKFETFL